MTYVRDAISDKLACELTLPHVYVISVNSFPFSLVTHITSYDPDSGTHARLDNRQPLSPPRLLPFETRHLNCAANSEDVKEVAAAGSVTVLHLYLIYHIIKCIEL